MVHIKTGSKNNLALHSLIIARSMEINFRTDLFKVDQWSIKGGINPLRRIFWHLGSTIGLRIFDRSHDFLYFLPSSFLQIKINLLCGILLRN